jgi:hypothetical protein
LQYADDTHIVIKADHTHLLNLKCILDGFSMFTGLHRQKHLCVPIAIAEDQAALMAASMGCPVGCGCIPANIYGPTSLCPQTPPG